jgi:hypothetical protein
MKATHSIPTERAGFNARDFNLQRPFTEQAQILVGNFPKHIWQEICQYYGCTLCGDYSVRDMTRDSRREKRIFATIRSALPRYESQHDRHQHLRKTGQWDGKTRCPKKLSWTYKEKNIEYWDRFREWWVRKTCPLFGFVGWRRYEIYEYYRGIRECFGCIWHLPEFRDRLPNMRGLCTHIGCELCHVFDPPDFKRIEEMKYAQQKLNRRLAAATEYASRRQRKHGRTCPDNPPEA